MHFYIYVYFIYIYIYNMLHILYLLDATARLFQWFSENQMKVNTDKSNLLMSKKKSSEIIYHQK